MSDLAKRFTANPIINPRDVKRSREGFEVVCTFNPGAFEFNGRFGLVVRVAERRTTDNESVESLSISRNGEIEFQSFSLTDPKLKSLDSRSFIYNDTEYITTLSHFRLAWSSDGEKFSVEDSPILSGSSDNESFGIEDTRVTKIGSEYFLTYTGVSSNGYGVQMKSTTDWKTFKDFGTVLPPFNKDAVLFDEKINGKYQMLHRPTGSGLGGPYIWSSTSTDLFHWGHHVCVATTRPNMWDSARIGAGSAPIKTEAGWLEIYHGAEVVPTGHTYRLGALLLDLDDPTRVIARSQEPIMEPRSNYETDGFYGNVVFTNGQIVQGDEILLYYGAADTYTCGARFSIKEILNSLKS